MAIVTNAEPRSSESCASRLAAEGATVVVAEINREQATSKLPLGRAGSTDEQANAALSLLSDAAAFIIGQSLCGDGGQICTP